MKFKVPNLIGGQAAPYRDFSDFCRQMHLMRTDAFEQGLFEVKNSL